MTKYLEFKAVEGAFVLGKGGSIHKVPATDSEALKSSLMGLFEKRRARAFFLFVQDYEADHPKTHKGHDLDRMPMKDLYAAFGLEANTIGASPRACAYTRRQSAVVLWVWKTATSRAEPRQQQDWILMRLQGG